MRLNAAADPASRVDVLDPNVLDPEGHTAIDWFVASPDGSKIAVSLSKNGSEDGVLHVYDVASGREIETPIGSVQYPTAGGALAWTADGGAFWYTRYPGNDAPEAERHFNMAVYFHRLGAGAAGIRWRCPPPTACRAPARSSSTTRAPRRLRWPRCSSATADSGSSSSCDPVGPP